MTARITQDEINTIRRLAEQGLNRNRIARAINRAPESVKSAAKRNGITLVDVTNSYTEQARQRLVVLFYQGLSDLEIAAELGYGRSTIANERRRLELHRTEALLARSKQPELREEQSQFQILRMRLITEAWV